MKRKISVDFSASRRAVADEGRRGMPSSEPDAFWIMETGGDWHGTGRTGKWLVFVSWDLVDEMWCRIRRVVRKGKLGLGAKVSTRAHPRASDVAVICVYTRDADDKDDVMYVRRELVKLGVTWKTPYKMDADTHAGRYGEGTARYYSDGTEEVLVDRGRS